MDFYKKLQNKAQELILKHKLHNASVKITGKVLSTEEAIGNPERNDLVLLKGKESLIEADFKGYKGQAFTDSPGNFEGNVQDIVELPLTTNKNRAMFVSTINAIMNYLQLTQNNIHCHNEEPEKCADKLVDHIAQNFSHPQIGLIGLQTAMLDKLSNNFEIRTLDLDPENIGEVKYGVEIEDGNNFDEILAWSDILLVTGSTLVNGTIENFLNLNKTVIFYGTTIAAAAELMSLNRICFEAS